MAVVNMSKQFPLLRFGQFLSNALGDCDVFYMSDEEIYTKCRDYSTYAATVRVFSL